MRQLLFNGHIYQSRQQFVSALLIEDGIITQCGSDQDLLVSQIPETTMIDLQGKTVLPGFNDSHLHFYASAVARQMVELGGLTSIEAIIDQGKQFIQQHPETQGEALFGRGWNQDYFLTDVRLINRFDLDQISLDYPIVFTRVCGHVATCNSKALEILGISATTPQVEGGQIDFDAQGNPLGILKENAIDLLAPLQVSRTTQDRIDLLRHISRSANSYGITSVQTNDLALGCEEGTQLEADYLNYAQQNPTVRITHQLCFTDLEALNQRIQHGYHLHENDFYRYGPLKIFVDGSLGAHTAKMRQPYNDDPTTQGITCMPSDSLDQFIALADQNKIQIAIHAIGDGAMTQVLDAYQKVITDKNPNRHGIIHCQITDKPILQRFKMMNVLAYVQPIFLHYDLHIVECRVGKQLASTSYAFKPMENLDIHVSYGTDSPVEGLNVFHNIHCAINRQDLHQFPDGGFIADEKVDLETAIDALTSGSAYANFEENRKGRLWPGYVTDLIVLNQPIFELDPSAIKDVLVDLTMVDGKIVYVRS